MIKISPISKYNIYLSEKKEGPIHTKKQAENYLRPHGLKSQICYFYHEHQAHRFWCESSANEQKNLADAALTANKNTCLAMSVADCFPILLTAENSSVFSLIHGGWKPLLQNILELTVTEMRLEKNIKPEQISAWIGPGIRQCCYQFNDKPLQAELPDWKNAVNFTKGVWSIDLARYIKQELLRQGINKKRIIDYNHCTFCNEQQFFSHRRSIKNNEKDGRMLVAVESV